MKKRNATPSALAFALPFLLVGAIGVALYLLAPRGNIEPPPTYTDIECILKFPEQLSTYKLVLEAQVNALPAATNVPFCYQISDGSESKNCRANVLSYHCKPKLRVGDQVEVTVMIQTLPDNQMILYEVKHRIITPSPGT